MAEQSNGDLLISLSMTLFMLSLITEKISNFIKLNFFQLFFNKSYNQGFEKNRERNIQLLSAIVGIVVALICNANFFALLKQGGNVTPFENITFISIIGCIITGLFLSQGSKFFHDLLDALLYFKNMKRALSNKQELENTALESGKIETTEDFLAIVTGDSRQDEEGLNS